MKKIMICEDDKALIKVLADMTRKNGFEVVTVEDGSSAVSKFLEKKPDLLLLDIILPGKSGFDILEEIRVKHNSKTPVIIISNLDQDNDKALAKNLGISDYIVKSDISLRTLMSKINQALSK